MRLDCHFETIESENRFNSKPMLFRSALLLLLQVVSISLRVLVSVVTSKNASATCETIISLSLSLNSHFNCGSPAGAAGTLPQYPRRAGAAQGSQNEGFSA